MADRRRAHFSSVAVDLTVVRWRTRRRAISAAECCCGCLVCLSGRASAGGRLRLESAFNGELVWNRTQWLVEVCWSEVSVFSKGSVIWKGLRSSP